MHKFVVCSIHGIIGEFLICCERVVIEVLLEQGSGGAVLTVACGDPGRDNFFEGVKFVKVVKDFSKQ
jgi:hypothetical protein